ncbi:MAG: glutamate synthase subunit alpha, partial [Nitrospirales bacterium]|nr:glutamate synthase subunit alpha [Nitrospirales bacterium]
MDNQPEWNFPGLPSAQGLYHPGNEHDGCGIGFVAHIKGQKSHDIIEKGLEVNKNLTHRGAQGCDPCTGDGAGILSQIPHDFFHRVAAETGVDLPVAGAYGVGMVFLPQDAKTRQQCEAVFEAIIREEGQRFLGWRDVPAKEDHIGEQARKTMPAIRQFFVARELLNPMQFERKLYVIRKRITRAVRESALPGKEWVYISSLSGHTIVYKGMLLPEQVSLFYPDLADPTFTSALALVHSRFSTNTFPTWALAHPYRYSVHNGEINTLKGNVNWMRARQGRLASDLFG